MFDMRKQSSAMLDPTAPPQLFLEIDLTKLNRLDTWLSRFFYTVVGSFVALIALPANENTPPVIAMILVLAFIIAAWGFIITLGRMAATLHKSVIVWAGLTIITSPFGIIVSFLLMHSHARDARQAAVTKSD